MIQIAETMVPKVSQLANSIKRQLAELGSGWVEGEVQQAKVIDGNCYFTLADDETQLRGIIWRGQLQRIGKPPEAGTLVKAHYTRVDFYPRKGTLSLLIDDLRLTGVGELLRRRAETLRKLKAEGLTDRTRKRPLPDFPRRVGFIAGRDSAAWADGKKSLWDRYQPVDLVFAPAWVEGMRAVGSIIAALGRLQAEPGVDVIVLARGGATGVRELTPFDDEGLCRAIATSTTPVVTAVGHTPDRPNCDHVAAAFADVPGRAAELVVPSAAELSQEIDRASKRLDQLPGGITALAAEIEQLLARVRPGEALERSVLGVDGLGQRLTAGAERFRSERRGVLDRAQQQLQALRGLLPGAEILDLEGERLVGAVRQFLSNRGRDLDQLTARVEFLPSRLRTKSRDYRRAFDRLGDESDRSAHRRFSRLRELLDRDGPELARHARDVIVRIHGDVEHLLDLLQAKDPRQRGWLMAANSRGKTVTRASTLTQREPLDLHFIDGQAGVTVDSVEIDQGDESNGY